MRGFDVRLLLERRPAGNVEPFRLDVDFRTADGITVVCGASGAGKSSLLLSILGAERPLRGRIAIAGHTVFDSASGVELPIRSRRTGMVFQDALLFPHLDARQNVAFGVRGGDGRHRVEELLERVGARDLADHRPVELSGGQRQRVALARALAAEPAALLLDEPFSALDPAGRQSLGRLLIELQSATRIPFMHVTHDLGEALRLGSQLILLDRGRVVQSGPPAAVIASPASIAAARAVGAENLFSGRVVAHDGAAGCTEVDLEGTRIQTGLLDEPVGAEVALGLRAEDILLSLEPLHQTSARNVLPGTLERLTESGAMVELRVATPTPFRVIVTPASVRDLALHAGQRVYLLVKAAAFHRLT